MVLSKNVKFKAKLFLTTVVVSMTLLPQTGYGMDQYNKRIEDSSHHRTTLTNNIPHLLSTDSSELVAILKEATETKGSKVKGDKIDTPWKRFKALEDLVDSKKKADKPFKKRIQEILKVEKNKDVKKLVQEAKEEMKKNK